MRKIATRLNATASAFLLYGLSGGIAGGLAGCGSSALGSDGGTGAGHDGPAAVADAAVPAPDMVLPGSTTVSLGIGPIPLAGGEERTVCSRYRLSNTAPIDVVRLTAKLAPGSHHLILYKSVAKTEQKDIYDCQPLDILGGDIPLYIAETENNNTLPLPTGVAYHLEAGEMIRVEAHYLNATSKPIMGVGAVELTVGAPATYQRADIMFCGSVIELYKKGVPPGHTDLQPGFYQPPAGVKVFGLTTHQHKRGTLMNVEKSTSVDDPGTNLTVGKPYDNPPFRIWGDGNLLTFGDNEGLRWDCHYDNNGPKTYHFGQSAESDEMCFLWAYYYPSAGHFISQECWQ